MDKIAHLAPLGAILYELDTTSTSSITSLRSKFTRLDILFNNAGINYIGPLADTSMETFRQ